MLAKGWVKLQIEPVEVTIDDEQSLLFSTVQSVVPGAHGLYYRQDGQRRALNYDTNTGRVLAPEDGWQAQDIFVHIAHGTKHGVHHADYSKATAQFERNVTAIQKLIGGLGYGGYRGTRTTARTENTARSRSKVKSGFEAQPENVHLSEESEPARPSETKQNCLDILNHQIQQLQKENEDLKKNDSRASEQAQLEKLKARNSELESRLATYTDVIQSQEISPSNISVGSAEVVDDSKKINSKIVEKEEEINNLHNVIEELREQLGNNKKIQIDIHNELSQYKDLLKNAKDKISYLENQLAILSPGEVSIPIPKSRSRQTSESHDEVSKIRSLEVKIQLANNQLRISENDKQKLQEANWFANERVGKLEKEIGYLQGTTDELKRRLEESADVSVLAEKDRRITELGEQRAKLEWRLGELNQWWNDSKWKIGELESSLAHQKYLLETASSKILNLNDSCRPQGCTSLPPTSRPQQEDGKNFWCVGNSREPIIFLPKEELPSYGYKIRNEQNSRKVALELVNPENDEVFVLTSLVNWQCAVRCEYHRDGKTGVVLDMPRGHHQFRFLKNGSWITSQLYAAVPNGYGGYNNVIVVE